MAKHGYFDLLVNLEGKACVMTYVNDRYLTRTTNPRKLATEAARSVVVQRQIERQNDYMDRHQNVRDNREGSHQTELKR